MLKIYFDEAVLVITNGSDDKVGLQPVAEPRHFEAPSQDKLRAVIKEMEKKQQHTTIHTNNVQETFEMLKRNFVIIQAGGGLVYTQGVEVLLIFRRGKWDLPKGKLEEGENLPECALREVEEETGLQNITLGKKLAVTYHTYEEKGEKILKESHWYTMQASKQTLTAQTEEDIEECKWVPLTEIAFFASKAHPSVADVLAIGIQQFKK